MPWGQRSYIIRHEHRGVWPAHLRSLLVGRTNIRRLIRVYGLDRNMTELAFQVVTNELKRYEKLK